MSDIGNEPITLEEAKQQLRVDTDADDAYITRLIKSARATAEQHLKEHLIGHALQTPYYGFCDVLETTSKINTFTSITYHDIDGDQQTLVSADVVIDNNEAGSLIRPVGTWPELSDNRIEVLINYTSAPVRLVSEDIKIALLLTITDLYENRSDSVREKRTTSEVFLNRYRIPTL